jgi:hypothetical protein
MAQYVTNQATRIIVRAVGELSQESGVVAFDDTSSQAIDEEGNEPELEVVVNTPTPQEQIEYATYKPTIVGKEWILSETDLCDFSLSFHPGSLEIDHFLVSVFIMEGCGILGTVGRHLLPISRFANCVFRAAEARRNLRTLYVAKSYGMAARSVSQTIRPCLRMASSLVEVGVFGCWERVQMWF